VAPKLRKNPLAKRFFAAVTGFSVMPGIAAALLLSGCANAGHARPSGIGLFTTLPILWPEAHDLKDLLRSDAPPHWALAVLQQHGTIKPIDSLLAQLKASPLQNVGLLVMAQPRPLSAQENVALDRWIRRGGRLLLFADPMLTEDSAFGIGDRRRPQDIVLLSPILARWGLRLEFDDSALPGEHLIKIPVGTLPVNLPGLVVVFDPRRGCRSFAAGVGASCRIGKGHVLLLADAALLEKARPIGPEGHRDVLGALLDMNEISP
jgi:hypothetical protein